MKEDLDPLPLASEANIWLQRVETGSILFSYREKWYFLAWSKTKPLYLFRKTNTYIWQGKQMSGCLSTNTTRVWIYCIYMCVCVLFWTLWSVFMKTELFCSFLNTGIFWWQIAFSIGLIAWECNDSLNTSFTQKSPYEVIIFLCIQGQIENE